jgi:hypothetical protein
MPSIWTDRRNSTMQERERPVGNDALNRIIGGSPVGVAVRLVLLSIVVGFILHTAGIDPKDIFRSMEQLIQRIWNLGLEPLRHLWTWFLIGAVVVVPIWLLIRLTRGLTGK